MDIILSLYEHSNPCVIDWTVVSVRNYGHNTDVCDDKQVAKYLWVAID